MRKINLQKSAFIIIFLLFSVLFFVTIIDFDELNYTNQYSDHSFANKNKIVVAFRNDDVSANSNILQEKSALDIFWKYKIKQTFAFIPNLGDENIERIKYDETKLKLLKEIKNWYKEGKIELALHGYTHQKSSNSIGEFRNIPYEMQLIKIKAGKKILDDILYSHVNIFCPPWNQADENTLFACVNSGINVFSGFLGEKPTEGITFVNSNAVLFHSDYYNGGEKSNIPDIHTVLEYAKKGEGIRFIIVLYHSRTDLKEEDDYLRLDGILDNLKNDPEIEISSIGDISKKYIEVLPAYNQAGLNIKEASYAKHVAKPYVIVINKVMNIMGKADDIDRLAELSKIKYWKGEFKESSKISIEIIKKYAKYIKLGRFLSGISALILFLVFFGYIKIKAIDYISRSYLLTFTFFISPILLFGLYLNTYRPVSSIRVQEFNIVAALFLGFFSLLALISGNRPLKSKDAKNTLI